MSCFWQDLVGQVSVSCAGTSTVVQFSSEHGNFAGFGFTGLCLNDAAWCGVSPPFESAASVVIVAVQRINDDIDLFSPCGHVAEVGDWEEVNYVMAKDPEGSDPNEWRYQIEIAAEEDKYLYVLVDVDGEQFFGVMAPSQGV